MAGIEKFKKLIKEAVREVLREEQIISPKIKINENSMNNFGTNNYPINNIVTKPITGDPMLDILNETRNSMNGEDFQNIGEFNSNHVQNFQNFSPKHANQPVGNIKDMLQTSGLTEESVDINIVPDYSKFMDKM